MGQISNPQEAAILLTDIDRLVAENAAQGMDPPSQHVIALGQNAARNLTGGQYVIALGVLAGADMGIGSQDVIAIGQSAGFGMGTVQDVIAVGRSVALGRTRNDAIVIGYNSANGTGRAGLISLGWDNVNGITTGQANAADMVAIGRGIFPAVTDFTSTIVSNKMLGIGSALFTSVPRVSSTIAIGHNIANNTGSLASSAVAANVLIGHNIASNWLGDNRNLNQSVIIGYEAARGLSASNAAGITSCVYIGYQAARDWATTGNLNNTFVGAGAGANFRAGQSNVLIGGNTNIGPGTANSNNTVVGANATVIGTTNTRAILIGAGSTCNSDDIVIGTSVGSWTANKRGVYIGNLLTGSRMPDGTLFVVDHSPDASNRYGMIVGDFLTGNIVFGNSTLTSRSWPTSSTNGIKILHGARGTGSPVGGGVFWNTSAEGLSFVRANGEETRLTPPNGVLATSLVAYTDGAGAATGTLTNAPAAGDPTKWIPVDDNGTTRYIPAW